MFSEATKEIASLDYFANPLASCQREYTTESALRNGSPWGTPDQKHRLVL